MKNVDLHHGASTDVGLVRKVNEDSYLVAPPVFVVADGMGGHSGGDVASQMVVEEFRRMAEAYDPARGAELVSDAFARAQARIVDYGTAHRALHPGWHAGTTAVVAVLVDDDGVTKWLLANLGDSRIYRIAEGRLEQVSVDHSVVQELVDSGELAADAAQRDARRNVITRAIGAGSDADPDYWLIPAEDGDRILVCSDGLSGELEKDAIHGILLAEPDPQAAATRLVHEAMVRGGRDNITAIVVDALSVRSRANRSVEHDTVPVSAPTAPVVDIDGDTLPRAAVTGGL
jgi:serine/threonine protein phosphatase PrpC